MGLLDGINPVQAISKAIFGDKGISGGITDILERTGVFKKLTPEETAATTKAINDFELAKMDKENIVVQAVNQTMQTEANSEHWMQWAWRPVLGFVAGAVIINNYILIAYIPSAKPIVLDAAFWAFITAVLGVASLGRAAVKYQNAKNDGAPDDSTSKA